MPSLIALGEGVHQLRLLAAVHRYDPGVAIYFARPGEELWREWRAVERLGLAGAWMWDVYLTDAARGVEFLRELYRAAGAGDLEVDRFGLPGYWPTFPAGRVVEVELRSSERGPGLHWVGGRYWTALPRPCTAPAAGDDLTTVRAPGRRPGSLGEFAAQYLVEAQNLEEAMFRRLAWPTRQPWPLPARESDMVDAVAMLAQLRVPTRPPPAPPPPKPEPRPMAGTNEGSVEERFRRLELGNAPDRTVPDEDARPRRIEL